MKPNPPIPTPATPAYFDYLRAGREANLTAADLGALVGLFESEYPSDLMLRELHILRACRAIERGSTTLRQVLAGSAAA